DHGLQVVGRPCNPQVSPAQVGGVVHRLPLVDEQTVAEAGLAGELRGPGLARRGGRTQRGPAARLSYAGDSRLSRRVTAAPSICQGPPWLPFNSHPSTVARPSSW